MLTDTHNQSSYRPQFKCQDMGAFTEQHAHLMSTPSFWRITHIFYNLLKVERKRCNQEWYFFSIFCLFCCWTKIKLLTFKISWWKWVWNETSVCLNRRALASIIKFFLPFNTHFFLYPLGQISVLMLLMSIWHALHKLHTEFSLYGPPAIKRCRLFLPHRIASFFDINECITIFT